MYIWTLLANLLHVTYVSITLCFVLSHLVLFTGHSSTHMMTACLRVPLTECQVSTTPRGLQAGG